MNFTHIVDAWPDAEAKLLLKQAIEGLEERQLPLQKGLSFSSVPSDEPWTAVVLSLQAVGDELVGKASVFYSGLIAGCACDDDPTPQETIPENCEIEVTIDRETGAATVALSD